MTQFRMTSVMLRLVVVVGMAPGLFLCQTFASAAEPEIYPVLWSESLELESLDGIDARLDLPLYPYEDGLRIYKEVDGNYWRQAMASDCGELLELSSEGYYGLDNESMYIHLFFAARCRAIRMLASARPAETSYLRDFALTPEAVAYLPAMMNAAPGCARFCRHVAANAGRVPLSEYETVLGLEFVPVETRLPPPNLSNLTWAYLIVWIAGWEISLEIVGRGDFDGDSVDDILVLVHVKALAGRDVAVNLFVLTREKADAVLRVVDGDHDRWVLDADPTVCTAFPCETRDAHR